MQIKMDIMDNGRRLIHDVRCNCLLNTGDFVVAASARRPDSR